MNIEPEREENEYIGTITSDMILDLYEQTRDMDDGPAKYEKVAAIGFLSLNLGKELVKC
jgi:hypothetical protein